MRRYETSVENGRGIPDEVRRILVPVDFSESSRAALDWALDVAAKKGAAVDALHVWEVPTYTAMGSWSTPDDPRGTQGVPTVAQRVQAAAAEELDRLVESAKKPGVVLEGILDSGDPRSVIQRRASSYDLIAIGAHHEGLRELLMGNVTDRVAGDVDVPVVAVRAEGA